MTYIKISRKIVLEPSQNPWESGATFNPTVISDGKVTHLFYRAVKHPNFSSIGYAKIIGDDVIRYNKPVIFPTNEDEKEGTEDPRITFIDGKYYILYTAYDGRNARVAVAVSEDLKKFKKLGLIGPNIRKRDAIRINNTLKYKEYWRNPDFEGEFIRDKDAVLFPEKINGKFAMLHRLEPDIEVVYFDDFKDLQDDEFWYSYIKELNNYYVMGPRPGWEEKKVGAGPIPIKTRYGWLLIYHGTDKKRRYCAGAALLDLKDPRKVIARFRNPLFEPIYEWEKVGDVNNVVFPEGAIVEDGKLKIYYGCADTRTAVAEMDINELLQKLIDVGVEQ